MAQERNIFALFVNITSSTFTLYFVVLLFIVPQKYFFFKVKGMYSSVALLEKYCLRQYKFIVDLYSV